MAVAAIWESEAEAEDGPVPRPLLPALETQLQSQALRFCLPQSGHCSHLGN